MGKRLKKFQNNRMNMQSKLILEHENEFPSDIKDISKIQPVIETYYNKDLPKTDDIDKFLKRKPRYEFCVFLNRSEYCKPAHKFIFDKKKDADKAHDQCLAIYIDERIEPYRKMVEDGKKLTKAQMKICEDLQNLLPED